MSKKTYIRNAQVYIEHFFVEKTILIEDGKLKVLPAAFEIPEDAEVFDASGLYAVPGFIDIHTHGAAGVDINSADTEGLLCISEFFADCGVTSWLASVLTDTEEQTLSVLHKVQKQLSAASLENVLYEQTNGSRAGCHNHQPGRDPFDCSCNYSPAASELLGVHLEGPFLAHEYKGAMPEELLKKPDPELLEKYQKESGNCIKYLTVSPELNGTAELIEKATELGITVSIGHSGATYEEAMKAIEKGAASGTHVGNAMRLFHQHEPAIFGALLESDCYCEIIADGIHLVPGTVKMLSKIKGVHRLIAISDSIMAAGLPDGDYKLGVNEVVVSDGDAKLKSDGTRAGSTLTLDRALKNIIKFTGLSFEEVIPVLTENPARLINVYDRKGSIEDGKDADIVFLNENSDIIAVYARGVKVK